MTLCVQGRALATAVLALYCTLVPTLLLAITDTSTTVQLVLYRYSMFEGQRRRVTCAEYVKSVCNIHVHVRVHNIIFMN